MDWLSVVCPTCFESFEIPPPDVNEAAARLDYDCEVCCRPMVLSVFVDEEGRMGVEAMSMDGTDG